MKIIITFVLIFIVVVHTNIKTLKSFGGAVYEPISRRICYFNMENLENEIWKDIVGYEGMYQVSNFGRVKTLLGADKKFNKKEAIIKLGNRNGYTNSHFYKDGKRVCLVTHRLVAMYFLPNPENKREVNHKNGVRNDNRVENLEWVTPKENIQHAIRTGLINHKGVKNSMAKLNNEKVVEIKKRLRDGIPHKLICTEFGVARNTISCINIGYTWSHIKI